MGSVHGRRPVRLIRDPFPYRIHRRLAERRAGRRRTHAARSGAGRDRTGAAGRGGAAGRCAPPERAGRPRRRLGAARPELRTAPGGVHRALPPDPAARPRAARRAVRTAHDTGRVEPCPDAAEVLRTLRERGIAIGVVSNIGCDLHPVFREHGLDRYVDAYVLSYEHGIHKPGRGCSRPPARRSGPIRRDADGGRRPEGGQRRGGARLRRAFRGPLPVTERPDGLRPVLDLIGRSGRRRHRKGGSPKQPPAVHVRLGRSPVSPEADVGRAGPEGPVRTR